MLDLKLIHLHKLTDTWRNLGPPGPAYSLLMLYFGQMRICMSSVIVLFIFERIVRELMNNAEQYHKPVLRTSRLDAPNGLHHIIAFAFAALHVHCHNLDDETFESSLPSCGCVGANVKDPWKGERDITHIMLRYANAWSVHHLANTFHFFSFTSLPLRHWRHFTSDCRGLNCCNELGDIVFRLIPSG